MSLVDSPRFASGSPEVPGVRCVCEFVLFAGEADGTVEINGRGNGRGEAKAVEG